MKNNYDKILSLILEILDDRFVQPAPCSRSYTQRAESGDEQPFEDCFHCRYYVMCKRDHEKRGKMVRLRELMNRNGRNKARPKRTRPTSPIRLIRRGVTTA